ncbi:hypothetical protein TNCV_2690641 [Trichonephila clavipes]|uniref:Uncharacterized protein n=1 Tax=Trichonephila clavipes TaxID=2585209 RepID=A0A8X7BAI2_TRICX|nr:hypothetical protein TNCV_2690641 [Trichonephila clavipes]
MNSGSYSAWNCALSIRSVSQSDGENFCFIEIKDIFEQLKKCLVAGFKLITSNCQSLKEGGWANRRIARYMGRSDEATTRCWQEWLETWQISTT